ncbi:MAG: PD40 domain-containing protein [Acidobacteria bacterium]|nr:PD40 domain-containing protein [Acidobacteriota bacterium]
MTRRTILICAALVGLVVGPAAWSQKTSKAELRLQEAHRKETIDGDLKSAIDLYRKAISEAGSNRSVAANAMLRLGGCYERQGNAEARRTYERLVKEFGDQKDAARDAQARLVALGPAEGGGAKAMTAQLVAQGQNAGQGGHVTLDGRLLVFVDGETLDIAVRDLHSGAVRRLTNGGTQEGVHGHSPIPSRNGKQIVYSWNSDAGVEQGFELRVVNVDGSGMRTVPLKLAEGDSYYPVDWSTDGKSILAHRYCQSCSSGLVAVDLTTGGVRQIPKSEGAWGDMAGLSRDGRYVVYARSLSGDDTDWDIFALDTQTGRETLVVSGTGADRNPVWVPDSDAILFRSDRSGRNAIWMVRVRDGQATGAPVLIKPDAGEYEARGVSRDGSLFYAMRHRSQDIYQAHVDPKTLQIRGAPSRAVETSVGHNSWPLWSPKGDSFAYHSEREKKARFVVHQRDGKETVVADPARWTGGLHWCATGDRLTSWGTPMANQLQLFDARTGAALPPQPINGLSAPYQLGFSPDCTAVFVSTYSRQTKRRRIYRYDVSTGKQTDILADSGEWATYPRVSPDGRWLALYGRLEGSMETGIVVVSTTGGAPRMLDSKVQWGHNWTPDSRRLLYARSVKGTDGKGEENELFWIAVEGGAPQSMGIRMPGARAASLNPDGNRILFSASSEVSNELWVLRNLPINEGRKTEPVPANKPPAVELISKGRSVDFTGRITPDGRLLTFVDSGSGNIAVRDLRSGEVRRLTREGGGESPVPSRNGKEVAYVWHHSNGQTELRVVPIEGGSSRTVPVKPHAMIVPADWSPDGKTLVALWRESDSGWQGVATVDLLTGDLKRLVSCDAAKCRGVRDINVGGFSPDGRWIVYSRPTAPNWWLANLYVVDRQTREETALLKEQNPSKQPMWIPHSDKILFQSERNGKNGIWMLRLQSGFADGMPVLVRHDVGETDWKGISRDGTLVYGERRTGSFIYQATIDLQTMRIADVLTKVSDAHPGKAHRPSWAPSGDLWSYLVMRGERQGSTYAMVIRQPDGKAVEVAHDAEPRYLPRWCEADGRTFVYRKTETFGLRYDARSGTEVWATPDLLRRQPQGSGLTWGYTFSPDCKRVYITSFTPDTSRRRVVSHDLTTGKEDLLLDEPGNFSQGLYVSPDGRWLASVGHVPGKGMGILAIPTAGGPVRMIAQVGFGEGAVASGNLWAGTAVWQGVTWTPDSKRVLFPHSEEQSPGAANEIFWASIDGGGRQPTGIFMRDATTPSIHPDGKRVLFSAADDTEELWVLRNLPLN